MTHERFRYYLRVRYSECDAQKVVFNANYGNYVDLAMSEYLRALGFTYAPAGAEPVAGCPNPGFILDFQLVKQTTQWRAPARYDQVLELSVATRHLGTTSFTLATEFRLAGEQPLIATCETVYVHVDGHTLSKAPLPEPFRAALERGAPGVRIDHAGYF